MRCAPHPLEVGSIELDPDVQQAIEFEISTQPADIDVIRQRVLDFWTERALELREEQQLWAREAAVEIRPIVSRLHGPLAREMADAIRYEDPGVVDAWQLGFDYVGELPAGSVAVRPGLPKPLGFLKPAELRSRRSALNRLVTSKLKASDWDQDVLEQTIEDVDFGAMAVPWKLSQWHLDNVSLSRRIPVREERDGSMRTRVVDHKSESEINLATQPTEKLSHDTIDSMVKMVQQFVVNGCSPLMWKRDIGKAFRRLPVRVDHLDLSWVVFLADGVRMVAQHLAMPFGTTSAVHGWHRTGAFLAALVRRLCLAPVSRYVDDYEHVHR